MIKELEKVLKLKKSAVYSAKRLNITEEEYRRLRKEHKGSLQFKVSKSEEPKTTYVFEQEVNQDLGTIKSSVETDYDPKSDEELALLHRVDLSKYKISSYWSKLKSNGKFTSSIFATLKKPQDYTAEDFAKFLEGYNASYIASEYNPSFSTNVVDVEISIADFHLAKKTITNETLEDKVKHFTNTVQDLVQKVQRNYEIDKLIFPISNDFFHTDNYQNQTTNGTPQDVLVGYDHEYEVGFDLLVKTIDFLQSAAKEVQVVLVQGNHDRTKSFYLAHALEVFFNNTPSVSFKREHSTTKSVVLGNTFIGYHHGNCKIDDLPLLFATGSDSSAFGNAKYREVHTGDKHHYMAKEVKGVRIQQMPSLSDADRWHSDNNFVHSIRCGIATCYDFLTGRVAEFESRLPL